jgi:hypothetical protein
MKLEPDLIKEILIWCEEKLPDENKSWLASEIIIPGYSKFQTIFHVKLLFDNGYIEGTDSSVGNTSDYFLENLTLNGYQYLSLLRSKAWNTAKEIMHDVGVIFAESAIRAVINKYLQ